MLIKIAKVFSVSTDYLLGLETEDHVDVSGLSNEVVSHIRQIVDDLKNRK